MKESNSSVSPSIKVGVITDQTGALSFMGIANANVAKMVINGITNGLEPLDELRNKLIEESNYNVDAKRVNQNRSGLERIRFSLQFSNDVGVTRRPRDRYTLHIEENERGGRGGFDFNGGAP